MEAKEILKEWSISAASLRRPALAEACDVIGGLCLKVAELDKEVLYQKNRQDLKEREYKVMMMEIQNIVSKYSRIEGN